MKRIPGTMTIDHVTITEFPKTVDDRARRRLIAGFERLAVERRVVHLIILPNAEDLDSESLALLTDLNRIVHKAGGAVGLVTRGRETSRVLSMTGIDRYFKCFTSVNTGVEFLAPLGRRLSA